MDNIIEKILSDAKSNFENFGFKEDDITYLLNKARDDLEKQFSDLKQILEKPSIDIDKLDKSLHALKGLIMQLGSIELANKINSYRELLESNQDLEDLKNTLRL